jgi:transcriptional regulator
MKRIAYIVVILCMFLSCGIRREYKDALLRAETVMDEHPDSALQILDSLGQYETEFSRHFRMQYQLHRQNAVNKTSDKFTSDSLCQVLVHYFDRHGNVNERVLAHYLLGRAYTDMGEAPMAISKYQDAIDAADTTVANFNYRTLSNVYAQMADLYHYQFLLTNEIEARKKASLYAFRANQPLWGIYNQDVSAGAYILLNKKDSAEIILKSTLEQYREHGYTQRALFSSKVLMHLYTDPPQRLAEAKVLMDKFEAESELFDEHHELPPSQHQYYYYKGKYYEGINRLDSAEYYYRKIHRPKMSFLDQDPMYKGLLSVFTKRHQADSIAKYAKLYCMANDSSIALKDRDVVAQMTATYNYSRLQKEAHENEVKAYKTLLGLVIAAAVAVLALVAAFLVWKRFRRKYQQEIMQLKTEYANASYEYEENLRELQLLESAHQENESERKRLLDENVELQSRIHELQKEKAISRNLSASALFAEEPIVKRFHEIAVQPLANVKEEEWVELTDTFANSYPDLFLDLCQYCNTPQSIRVCMLTVMGLGNNEQANLLGTTSSRISNVKLALNKALFNESSSRTLNKNLLMQYSVY